MMLNAMNLDRNKNAIVRGAVEKGFLDIEPGHYNNKLCRGLLLDRLLGEGGCL